MPEISRDIIVKASQGDVEAFEMIYKEYASLVYQVTFRVVNRQEDAEDVTQDVFVNIYHNLKSFRFGSALKTWIYRVAFNSAINHARRVSKHNHPSLETTAMEAVTNVEKDVRHKMDQESQHNAILNLLDDLSPEHRACIVLRSLEGLSYQEIGKVLNIPINTVRSRIKRARETMLAKRKEVWNDEL